MVTHMVMFKFDDAADAQEACKRLLSMQGKIPSMISIEAGVDFTRGQRSFELGLVSKHACREDLEAYRVHPVHQEVAAFIKEKSSGAAAVDFES